MQAFFADIDEADHLTKGKDRSPTVRSPELIKPTPEQIVQISDLQSRIGELEKKLGELRKEQKRRGKKLAGEDQRKKLTDAVATAAPQSINQGAANGDAADDAVESTSDPNEKSTEVDETTVVKDLTKYREELDVISRQVRATMITVSIKPRTIRVLPRGNWMDDSGEIVQPEIPEFMGKLDVGDRRSTRLDLANWLTDSDRGVGGLTARVMANRFWYLMFGGGIARVLDDLGGQGEAPSHPELLDALALEFVNCGWNVKHTIKQLVMSRAYRQASLDRPDLRQRDPLNQLLARQSQFRYPAETVRDGMLAISGLLVRTIGGQSARPYQPAGYYRHLNFPEREYVADRDDGQWRRGVYMHWQRQYLHPMLKAFDAPTREECTAQRPKSNTPLAALVLLNDPSFVEASRAFAARIVAEGGDSIDARLNFAYRHTVSRDARVDERKTLSELLESSRDYYKQHAKDATQLLGIGLKPSAKELDAAELAAWTVVARTILITNEALTRS